MLNMKFKFGKPAFHMANNPVVEKTNIWYKLALDRTYKLSLHYDARDKLQDAWNSQQACFKNNCLQMFKYK